MWPDVPPSTAGYHPRAIELHVFVPTEDGEYQSTLHEDDGLTFAFRQGAYYRTTFTLRKAGDQITLQGSVTGNGYPEFAREAFHLIFHGASPNLIHTNDQSLSPENGKYILQNAGTDFQIDLNPS
jgi:alpha-glucosidase